MKASGMNGGASIGAQNPVSIQLESLQVLSELSKYYSSKTLQPHLSMIIPSILIAAQNKSPQISTEALFTTEQMSKVFTPPRSAAHNQENAALLQKVLVEMLEILKSRSVDLSSRKQAVHVIGVLLGRTCHRRGGKLLSPAEKQAAFNALLETSKNETTRYAAIKSIELLAENAQDDTVFDPVWLSNVCLELVAQLRKADRSIRGASLSALRNLLNPPRRSLNLDAPASKELISQMTTSLGSNDLHVVLPVTTICTALVRDRPNDIVGPELEKQLCVLVTSSSASTTLEHVCTLISIIGESGLGKPLMQSFLQEVGINGSPAIVGRAIGTLLVSGGPNIGVTKEDFLKEANTSTDDRRKCLALSVLGEVGLQSGARSGLTSNLFFIHFSAKAPEVQLAAAVALGRTAAGPGNVSAWLPMILSRTKDHPNDQYLCLHSIREALQNCENHRELAPMVVSLWETAVSASGIETSKAIAADCMANMTLVDCGRFLPALQVSSLWFTSNSI